MKVHEPTRIKLVANLKEFVSDLESELSAHIHDIETVSSVESIMNSKRLIMDTLLNYLTPSDLTCYFCLMPKDRGKGCSSCGFATIHGFCGSPEGHFQQLLHAINVTGDAINVLHPKGEAYSE